MVLLDQAVHGRKQAIARALPDTVDSIVTMVEAGLSIDAALWRVAQPGEDPIARELYVAMRETTLGRPRHEALTDVIVRTESPELRTFLHAIMHAQRTGVPLGQVLRVQAREARLKKRQRAEEIAAKAPLKTLLIMMFFVMPSLFIIMLGPAVIRMSEQI